MYRSLALTSLTLLSAVRAQQVGTSTTENHPKINWKTCTGTGGNSCTSKSAPIVLDSNWRWTHTVGGYVNCYTGNSWDTSLCPDGDTCAKNCAVDGAEYSSKSRQRVMLHQFTSNRTQVPTVSQHPAMP
jgi:cellulose 1,4-beta-cellobiosidase